LKGKDIYSAIAKGFLPLLLVFTLLPLFILSFYNHPCSDDYGVTITAIRNGFAGAMKYYYLQWSGRYFASILISINPLVFKAGWAYKLNAVAGLSLLLIATWWLSGKVFPTLNKAGKLGITSAFIFALLMRMPDIASAIFWQTGSYTCFTGDIIALFLFGCIVSYSGSLHKKRYLLLSGILAILAIGCYELHLVYIDLIILLFAFFNILKRRDIFFYLTLIIICIIFSVFSILAPGNRVRALDYPNAHKLLFSIKESTIYGITILTHWLPFMLLTGLLLFDFFSYNLQWKSTNTITTINPWIILTGCIIIPFIGLSVCYWAEGEAPPLRAVNISFFYFVTGMLYFSYSLIERIKNRYPEVVLPVYIKLPVYIIIVFLLLFRTNNINLAYNDLYTGTAAAYNRERNERHEYLSNFKGDSCMIDSINIIPHTLLFSELLRDNKSWVNTSFWEYYNKKYIGIKGR
jgi:hypothetical protein